MSKHIAIAEYESLSKAAIGLEVLEKSDFTNDEVTLISIAEGDGSLESVTVADSDNELVSGGRTGLGMLIGGTVAAPVAIGTMIGPFSAAYPRLPFAHRMLYYFSFHATEHVRRPSMSATRSCPDNLPPP